LGRGGRIVSLTPRRIRRDIPVALPFLFRFADFFFAFLFFLDGMTVTYHKMCFRSKNISSAATDIGQQAISGHVIFDCAGLSVGFVDKNAHQRRLLI